MYLNSGIKSRAKLAMGPIRQVGFAGIFSAYFFVLTFNELLLTVSRNNKHNILKVSTSLPNFPTATDRELNIYKHLVGVNSKHPGQSLIRELYDSFYLESSVGKHCCLVLQPMHLTLLEMMGLNPEPFSLPLLKMTVERILLALDFLHTEAEIVHTGT